ncbi:hypothetical protein AB3S75_004463 [Citrus x aurantiifolia]
MATEHRACLPTLCTFCLLNARWCSVNLDSSFVCSHLLIHSARHVLPCRWTPNVYISYVYLVLLNLIDLI